MSPYIILPPRPTPRRSRRLMLAHAIVITVLFSWSCLIGWALVEFFSWLFSR